MHEVRKDVYLLGDSQPGVIRQQLVQNLAILFKKESAAIEKMLDRQRFLLKKDVDAQLAAKYRSAIEKAGGRCELIHSEPETLPAEAAVVPPAEPHKPPIEPSPKYHQPAKRPIKKWSIVGLSVVIVAALAALAIISILTKQQNALPDALPVAPELVESGTPDQSAGPDLSNRLFSADRLLSINVPASWQEQRNLVDGVSIGAANPADEGYVIVIAKPREHFPEDYSLTEYMDAVLITLQQFMEDPQVGGQPRRFKLKGLPAEQQMITGQVDRKNITYLLTTIETDRGFFQVLSWTESSRYAINQPLMLAISESFTARSFPEH